MRFVAIFVIITVVALPPMGARAIEQGAYATPPLLEALALLPPPPRAGTSEARRDIDMVLAAQGARTPAQEAEALADAAPTFAQFAQTFGWPVAKLPTTAAFFSNLIKTQSAISSPAKDCFLAPRPFVADPRVKPLAQIRQDSENTAKSMPAANLPRGKGMLCRPAPDKPAAYSYSYPSGHATLGALAAIILSRIVPEQRDQIFARGWNFGWNRVVAGVHYPSDMESSRLIAAIIAARLDQDPRFIADLTAARAELRAALGLAP